MYIRTAIRAKSPFKSKVLSVFVYDIADISGSRFDHIDCSPAAASY